MLRRALEVLLFPGGVHEDLAPAVALAPVPVGALALALALALARGVSYEGVFSKRGKCLSLKGSCKDSMRAP